MELSDLKNFDPKNTAYVDFEKYLNSLEKTDGFGNTRVLVPELHKISKEFRKNLKIKEIYLFLNNGITFEVKLLQSDILPYIPYKDDTERNKFVNDYFQRVDSWGLVDNTVQMLRPVITKNKDIKGFFKKNLEDYLKSLNIWTVRFGLVMILFYYLEKDFLPFIFKELNELNSDEYYINMAIAWLVCESYIKHPDETEQYLKSNNLSPWCQNKALQKIRESFRVNEKDKEKLRIYKKITYK